MAFVHNPKVTTDGLVLYLDAANTRSYPTTGTTWNDLSGNGNTGTLTNGPTFNSSNGGTISFDGTDDRVTGTVPTLSTWSLSVWMLSNNISGATIYYPVSVASPSAGIAFGGTLYPNQWLFYDLIGNTFGGTISTNNWFNLVVTKTATSYVLYKNGIQDGGGTGNNLSIDQYRLGIRIDGFWPTNCRIANFLIYNKVLSNMEVLQNFNATRSRFGI